MAQFRQTAGKVVAFVGWAWIAVLLCFEAVGCVLMYQQDGFWAVQWAMYDSTNPFSIKTYVHTLLYLPGALLIGWGAKLRAVPDDSREP